MQNEPLVREREAGLAATRGRVSPQGAGTTTPIMPRWVTCAGGSHDRRRLGSAPLGFQARSSRAAMANVAKKVSWSGREREPEGPGEATPLLNGTGGGAAPRQVSLRGQAQSTCQPRAGVGAPEHVQSAPSLPQQQQQQHA